MELQQELKEKILKALNLEDIKPEDIDDDAPLFGDEGVGLDSIDALELIVLLEKEYGIRIKDPKAGKDVFKSIQAMAEFVNQNRKK
ncbi:MAG: phosphopantetheine-binding protein [Prevotella sp.]|nr:phosphopantetheine-binding protein [Prevotella sp.]